MAATTAAMTATTVVATATAGASATAWGEGVRVLMYRLFHTYFQSTFAPHRILRDDNHAAWLAAAHGPQAQCCEVHAVQGHWARHQRFLGQPEQRRHLCRGSNGLSMVLSYKL